MITLEYVVLEYTQSNVVFFLLQVLQDLWLLLGKSVNDVENIQKRLAEVFETIEENVPVKALNGIHVSLSI